MDMQLGADDRVTAVEARQRRLEQRFERRMLVIEQENEALRSALRGVRAISPDTLRESGE